MTETSLSQFEEPVLLCDAEGKVLDWNPAYQELLGEAYGAHIRYQASAPVLSLPTGQHFPVGLISRNDGLFLAHLLAQPTFLSIIQLVGRGLSQVHNSLQSIANAGLLEEPDGPGAHSLREILAANGELERLRRQLALLGVMEAPTRAPLNLRNLIREALSAIPYETPVHFPINSPACPVEVVREALLPALVGLVN